MSDIFPKWTNKLPAMVIVGGLLAGGVVTAGVTYYLTPKYARVGYKPVQPVAFSHAIHADQLAIDCRYCHNGVEKSWYSNVPAASTCMNCHNQVLKDDPKLALVRESAATGKPIPWVQIHKTPDFVYFNHSVHVNRGVSCVHCHGPVNKMDEVRHSKSLGMSFCLECHRDPAAKIRPNDQVFNLDWQAPEGFAKKEGAKLVKDWNVHPGESCSVCHR
ncbi:MAG: cytochrome C [Proteobacteria bacterium]|nr:cytochrome C [Verrucomicrobiota bacterium]NBU10811.1 cytochrome C [Pseudomonadota bacterium]